NVNESALHEIDLQASEPGTLPVDAVYVCFDNDSLSLRTALTLHHRQRCLSNQPIPITVRMAESGGLAQLLGLKTSAGSYAVFANLQVFAMLEETCNPEVILGGAHVVLARAIHEDYVRREMERGETSATNAELVPWEKLPDEMRASNYAQADQLGANLCELGYGLAPLTDWDAAAFCFPDDVLKQMAQLEHSRYVAERHAAGWRYAPGPKDESCRTNPTLVPWEALPEAVRVKDINMCRDLPAFLARAGFQIVQPMTALIGRAEANPAAAQ
ncbi:MAG TPA: RyR domain-containing protein, partial [Anaerolineae bacterium]